ncbi:MAG: SDR family oxidoreductase [Granulosicoccus sp.]
MTLSSQVMLITGASRGIGRATAILAAQRGYAIGINYHTNRIAANEVASRCHELGVKTCVVQADIGKSDDIVRMFKTLDNELGTLDVLVNNTGVLEQTMRLENMSAERINRIMTTNVTGLLLCAKEAVLRMSTAKGGVGGCIVNISSRAAVLGSATEYVDYAASKGAVDTFTIGLATEVANEGIRVNAVRPGLIETDIHASGGNPDRVAKLKYKIPMQRGGSAEEVAHSILWLASAEASYTTGSFVDVSGGR